MLTSPAFSQTRLCEADQYYLYHPQTIQPLLSKDNTLFSRAITVLPIVVHVVWNTENENISQSAIEKQIDRLNLEFNNPYTSRKSLPEEFRPVTGNPGIQFCLVRRDPNGNPHSGIVRSQTMVKNIGSARDGFGKYLIHYNGTGQAAWNPQRYINIWIGKMENIFGRSTIGGTQFPAEEDGIVIDPTQVGVDFSREVLGRTLVHEMGHYLGLQHLWGSRIDDCTEDDGISDTPVQDGPYFGCPVYPQRSCGNNNMFMNFMDFVDDFCMDLFTRGQVIRMHQTLTNFRPGLLVPREDCMSLISPVELSTIKYYHQPSQQTLTVQAPSNPAMPVYIEVSNILGQRIYQQKWEWVASAQISTKSWLTGIYLINLRYNKERRTIKLFIP